mmetsp:Transcript_2349/g.4958  ORF Transcript_2349/g.4958 Transcript_2349/m.4958 type:complete len:82 (+) Transcript_2349:455-700(+)
MSAPADATDPRPLMSDVASDAQSAGKLMECLQRAADAAMYDATLARDAMAPETAAAHPAAVKFSPEQPVAEAQRLIPDCAT